MYNKMQRNKKNHFKVKKKRKLSILKTEQLKFKIIKMTRLP